MRPIIVANWKNHPATLKEAKALFAATKAALEKARKLALIIAPPAVFLKDIRSLNKSSRIAIAAQAATWDEEGAETGECTLSQLEDVGATYVLVGHAERRARGETDDDVRKIIARALHVGLTPILCVGEKVRDEQGVFYKTIRDQLREAFREVPMQKTAHVVVAYEPVWAIGGSRPMTPMEMHTMSIFIRKMLHDERGKAGLSVAVLYGGAIDETTALQMIGMGDVQGLLVGRASADPERVKKLLGALAILK